MTGLAVTAVRNDGDVVDARPRAWGFDNAFVLRGVDDVDADLCDAALTGGTDGPGRIRRSWSA